MWWLLIYNLICTAQASSALLTLQDQKTPSHLQPVLKASPPKQTLAVAKAQPAMKKTGVIPLSFIVGWGIVFSVQGDKIEKGGYMFPSVCKISLRKCVCYYFNLKTWWAFNIKHYLMFFFLVDRFLGDLLTDFYFL